MGKAKELKTTTDLVKKILEDIPATRNDDLLLYYRVCDSLNPMILNVSFGYGLLSLKEYKLPTFETVSRARKKVQEMYPHLRVSDNVEAGRMLAEETFKTYARTF